MKRMIALLCILELALAGYASPMRTWNESEKAHAVLDALASVDAAERAALDAQSLDDLNEAAYEQIVRKLNLTKNQRKPFETLYKAYRRDLDRAIDAGAASDRVFDDAAQRRALKAKLENIVAVAQVKRDYVDKFATILSAEQIRLLYNTEGQIGSSIKRATTEVPMPPSHWKGSSRMVTQDWGKVGSYTSIEAGTFYEVTVSPTARTVSVTAEDNVIDYLSMEQTNGILRFEVEMPRGGRTKIDISTIKVVVPASSALRSIRAGSYGKVVCKMPLRNEGISIGASSYGVVEADIDSPGNVGIDISSYGKFIGSLRCETGKVQISAYGTLQAPVTCRGKFDLSISSYAKFAENPIEASELNLSVSSYGMLNSRISVKDALRLSVGAYAKMTGSVACAAGQIHVSAYGSLRAPVSCSGRCALEIGSGAQVSEAIEAGDLGVSLGSNAKMRSQIKVREALTMHIGSYAGFSGSVQCATMNLEIMSQGSFNGSFAGRSVAAAVGNYGKLVLDGSAAVDKVKAYVGMNGSFSAPYLRVTDYSLELRNYASADIWCSGTLCAAAADSAKITYDGPCQVSANVAYGRPVVVSTPRPSNIRKR